MNFHELLVALSDAGQLLASAPVRWVAIIAVFLVVVESLMFIPYAGFVLKLAGAGIATTQVLALFASGAAGREFALDDLGLMLSWPVDTLLVLMLASLTPFALGLLGLYIKAGSSALSFFFGNILKDMPPADFQQFRFVILLAGLPFSFLPGAIVLGGLQGVQALSAALSAAWANGLAILMLAAVPVVFHGLTVGLERLSRRWIVLPTAIALLLVELAWTFALTFTLSTRVFAA